MVSPKTFVRKTLYSIHPINFRIKYRGPDKAAMQKQMFIEVIKSIKKIEDRRDFMISEIGMDMTQYEDQFFNVIENLLKLAFTKEQIGLIQLYLYDLTPDKDWDGTITVEVGATKQEKKVPFKTPEDVWNLINSLKK